MILLQSPPNGDGTYQFVILIAIIIFFILRRKRNNNKNVNYHNNESKGKSNGLFRMCPFCFNLTLRSRKRCLKCWYKID